jgi:hypothetical protein
MLSAHATLSGAGAPSRTRLISVDQHSFVFGWLAGVATFRGDIFKETFNRAVSLGSRLRPTEMQLPQWHRRRRSLIEGMKCDDLLIFTVAMLAIIAGYRMYLTAAAH